MDINVTVVSSKGQIVIPAEMRSGLACGEKLVVIRDGNRFVLTPVSKFSKTLVNDLEFARRTEEAYREIDSGKFREHSASDFVKRLKHVR